MHSSHWQPAAVVPTCSLTATISLPAGVPAGVPSATACLRHSFQVGRHRCAAADCCCFDYCGPACSAACGAALHAAMCKPTRASAAMPMLPSACALHSPPHTGNSVPHLRLQIIGSNTIEITFDDTEVKLAGGLQGWLDNLPTFSVPKLPEFLQVVHVLLSCVVWWLFETSRPPQCCCIQAARVPSSCRWLPALLGILAQSRAAGCGAARACRAAQPPSNEGHLTLLTLFRPACLPSTTGRRPRACALHALTSCSWMRACASPAATG